MLVNPAYVFDNFISTQSTDHCRDACLTFAKSPAPPSNPLFLHGRTSVGKTHLLYAMGHYVTQARPGDTVILVSAETMRNELYDAVNLGRMEQFRNRYASVDLLLVDDMQVLFRRERTQEEFSRIFETLVARRGRLALASSKPLEDLHGISGLLTSKLDNSLILSLTLPSEDELELILSKKYAAAHPPVPKRIIEMAVRQGTVTDVRRAEGLVKQMVFVESQSQ